MTEPRVGIVILNWNGWQDTVECLDSLRGLTYSNYDVIVVDNASTNDSVAQIRGRFPDIRIIESSENGGFAKGNNLGIRAFIKDAVDYVWLLNNDTTVSTLALTELVRTAQQNPCLGIVGSVLYEYDRPGKVQAWGGGKLNKLLGITKDMDREGYPDYITGASMLINANLLTHELLHEGYFFYMEDVDFSLKTISLGFGLGVAESSRIYHKNGSSIENTKNSKSINSDVLFSRSVGKYIRRNSNIFGLLLRSKLMMASRLMRREYGRIVLVFREILNGYQS